MITDLDSAIFF